MCCFAAVDDSMVGRYLLTCTCASAGVQVRALVPSKASVAARFLAPQHTAVAREQACCANIGGNPATGRLSLSGPVYLSRAADVDALQLKVVFVEQALAKGWSPAERKERQELLRAKAEAEQAQLRVQQMEWEAQVTTGNAPHCGSAKPTGGERVSDALCTQWSGQL